MKKYVCEPCGYIYDPEIGDPDNGIAPGTAFEDIPDDWVCPICFLGKEVFLESEQYNTRPESQKDCIHTLSGMNAIFYSTSTATTIYRLFGCPVIHVLSVIK